jgi:hypothetical protein
MLHIDVFLPVCKTASHFPNCKSKYGHLCVLCGGLLSPRDFPLHAGHLELELNGEFLPANAGLQTRSHLQLEFDELLCC